MKWSTVPFGDIIEDQTGGNLKVRNSDYLSFGKLPIVDQGQKKIGGYTDDLNSRCNAPLPCLIFGDHTRIVKFVDFEFALGADGVKVLVPKKNLDAKFAYFYLRQIKLAGKEGYQRNFKYLKVVSIPLPPLPIQKRIAAILEKADAAREKRRQTIELTEKFLQSAFLEMFGDPVTNPKGWDKTTIKNAGTIQTGTTPSSNKDGMFGGEIPFITPGDLESNEPNKRFVTKEGSENSRTVRKGATFVCCIGATIGKVGRAKTISAFNQQINAIEWNDGFNDLFGEMLMRFMKQIIIQKGGNSTTLPILNKGNFEKLEIIKPPCAHQQKFAALVEKVEVMLTKQRASELELENLFQSLMQRAFKGELVS